MFISSINLCLLIIWTEVPQLLSQTVMLTCFLSTFCLKSRVVHLFLSITDVFICVFKCAPKLNFSITVLVSNTLVHFSSFVSSCLSWFLSTEADRCSWLVLLSSTESGKITPSAQLSSIYPKQLWYSNITTVHYVNVCVYASVCVSAFCSFVWGGWGLDFILIAGPAVEEGQTYVLRARNKSTDTLAFSRRWPFRRSVSQPQCLPLSFCLPACPRPSSSRALEFLPISPNLPWLNVRITYFSAHTEGFN